jgi:GcrA cell cycle regulator
MQSETVSWSHDHSEALRQYLVEGMSYSAIAAAINAKYKTSYSRNATIGRAKRMGLSGPKWPKNLSTRRPRRSRREKATGLHQARERHVPDYFMRIPVFERTKALKLRCVEIVPRHLSLLDLEDGDCRYPYGGDEDGEAITFCGHPRQDESSYCTAHFHLTRGPCTPSSERSDTAALLRLLGLA